MLIYQILQQDHRRVESLLNELVNLADDAKNRDNVIKQIRDELIPHARAEETVFYNSLRALDLAKGLALQGYQEHFEAESLLRMLQVRAKIDAEWRKTAKKLRNSVLHHIQEEEGKIFAVAQQVFTKDEAEMMGTAFEQLKNEIVDEGVVATTMELVANLMPPRFAKVFRNFNLESRI